MASEEGRGPREPAAAAARPVPPEDVFRQTYRQTLEKASSVSSEDGNDSGEPAASATRGSTLEGPGVMERHTYRQPSEPSHKVTLEDRPSQRLAGWRTQYDSYAEGGSARSRTSSRGLEDMIEDRSSSLHEDGGTEVDSKVAVEMAQALLLSALGSLGSMCAHLCCVLTQPELSSPSLRAMGFASVKTVAHFTEEFLTKKEWPAEVDALLLVNFGMDGSHVEKAARALNQNENMPVLIVIMVVPFISDTPIELVSSTGHGSRRTMPLASEYGPVEFADFSRRMKEARKSLFEAGCDDAVCLLAGETLPAYRVMEIVQNSEFMARKMTEIIDKEVGAAEAQAARKLQVAYRRFLMMLPGRVLENIPPEDRGLEEIQESDGSISGAGQYNFLATLGAGSFGHVFKAEHLEHGICAVKVIAKASIKNANLLFSLDREFCLMQYLAEHPNVVKAIEVMHGHHFFYAAMEFAGPYNLQKFTKVTIQRLGVPRLPEDMVVSFSAQQGAAVSHLHGMLVCHRDLKPDNWIVDESGETLRLSDFGLAVQVVGGSQPLRQSCGSLPFCPPEVFQCEAKDPKVAGYNGLSADVWSLGLNFAELMTGPYSLEKLLKWVPRPPTDQRTVHAGLSSLAHLWQELERVEVPRLAETIAQMVVLDPGARCKVGHVVGPHGLGVNSQLRAPQTAARTVQARSNVATSGVIHRRRDDDDSNPQEPFEDEAVALSVRLGGASSVSAAFSHMLDRFLSTPGYSDVLDACPARVAALRAVYIQDVPDIFDAVPGSEDEKAIRAKIAKAHEGLHVLNAHFSVMVGHFRDSLQVLSLREATIHQAALRFEDIRMDVTAGAYERLAAAKLRHTVAWRHALLADIQHKQVADFAIFLTSSFRGGSLTSRAISLEGLAPPDLESHVMRYLGGSSGAPGGLLPLPEDLQRGGPSHLGLLGVARDALAISGWAPQVVETLYLNMLADWERAHDATSPASDC